MEYIRVLLKDYHVRSYRKPERDVFIYFGPEREFSREHWEEIFLYVDWDHYKPRRVFDFCTDGYSQDEFIDYLCSVHQKGTTLFEMIEGKRIGDYYYEVRIHRQILEE